MPTTREAAAAALDATMAVTGEATLTELEANPGATVALMEYFCVKARSEVLDDLEATVKELPGSESRIFHDAISRVHVLDYIAALRLHEEDYG